MRVNEPSRSLMRRPLALLIIVGVAVGAAFYGWTHATYTYRSSAAVMIVPAGSDVDTTGVPANPMALKDDTTAQLALLVGSQLVSDPVRDRVAAAGGNASYTAGAFGDDGADVAAASPLIELTATSPTADGAQEAIAVLIDQASAQVAAIQSASNVAPGLRARAVVATPASASAVVGSPQERAAGLWALVAGVSMAVMAAVSTSLFGRTRTPVPASTFLTPERQHTGQSPLPAPRPVEGHPLEPRRTAAANAAGRFAPPAVDQPVPAVEASDSTVVDGARPGPRRRQEVLRDMVRDDWLRSGNNIPWTREQQREAYQRAEDSLTKFDRRRREAEVENVSRFDDFVEYRDHG